jgi:hypothetical protein
MRAAARKKKTLTLPRKPMVQASRVALFERELRERLSAAAVELLFSQAQVLTEGRRADGPTAGRAFFGSVMITVDLAALGSGVRERCDELAAERVAAMMAEDARVIGRVRRLAEAEAGKLAGAAIRVHSADVRVRATGACVHVDVDVEE